MSKKIKFQNSTILLTGILLIVLGIFIGFSDFIKAKKDKVFSDMNLLLYKSETPQLIDSDIVIEERHEEYESDNKEENIVEESKPKEYVYDYIGMLEIPAINLKRGFLGLDSRYNNVDYNVTVIKGSTFPDEENNNLILAAHSGPCSVCYFNKLYTLSVGDVAHVTYAGVRHSYKIVNIYYVEKDGTVPIRRDYSKNVLTLITCTRNSKTQQTVYILEEY